ncbi:cytochrome P450 4C1-like [Temnothorax curvispinosus]|nr:cytochrome P450 4C1-like isoform X2 [Temnothorax curvispinosus]XP_024891370.1 cytochrome P450 4C1-like [Temnothorax curvispinosus]
MYFLYTITVLFILIVLGGGGFHYYIHYGRNGRLISLIPGPSGYPIFGNLLQYIGPREKQWKLLISLIDQYYPIVKLWGFSIPFVFIRHPDDLQTILSSRHHIRKNFFYDVLRPWMGNNILISEGAKWRSIRKTVTPAFHFDILKQHAEILIKEGENLTTSLKNTGGTVVKDLVSFVSEHTLNAICETSMGISLRDFGEFQQKYRKAVNRIGELFIYRLVRMWLHNDWIFSLTSKGKEQENILRMLHGFTNHIITERKRYHERNNGQLLRRNGKLSLLDHLIAENRKGRLTDLDVKEQIDGFMFAGHDTTALNLTYLLMLLAEHKDIQDRVRNEVNTTFQENGKKFNKKLLDNLTYLDRCIKETLRLYPSVFLISRVAEEDVKLQSYLVPAGTTVVLNIYGVHRDPNFWLNPETFDPDRFLPERTRNRHFYSYIPFSAGSRNCLGQRYAFLQIKALIAPLIQNYYLEPIDYLKNLRLQADLVLRPACPLRVKFVPI